LAEIVLKAVPPFGIIGQSVAGWSYRSVWGAIVGRVVVTKEGWSSREDDWDRKNIRWRLRQHASTGI
jgi:hypothetical protein